MTQSSVLSVTTKMNLNEGKVIPNRGNKGAGLSHKIEHHRCLQWLYSENLFLTKHS